MSHKALRKITRMSVILNAIKDLESAMNGSGFMRSFTVFKMTGECFCKS